MRRNGTPKTVDAQTRSNKHSNLKSGKRSRLPHCLAAGCVCVPHQTLFLLPACAACCNRRLHAFSRPYSPAAALPRQRACPAARVCSGGCCAQCSGWPCASPWCVGPVYLEPLSFLNNTYVVGQQQQTHAAHKSLPSQSLSARFFGHMRLPSPQPRGLLTCISSSSLEDCLVGLLWLVLALLTCRWCECWSAVLKTSSVSLLPQLSSPGRARKHVDKTQGEGGSKREDATSSQPGMVRDRIQHAACLCNEEAAWKRHCTSLCQHYAWANGLQTKNQRIEGLTCPSRQP